MQLIIDELGRWMRRGVVYVLLINLWEQLIDGLMSDGRS
jgi:hypothetical protein